MASKRITPKEFYKILKTEADDIEIDYSVTFRITDSCNFKCGYCFWHNGINYSLEDIKTTISKLFEFFNKERFKNVLIYFHGGEPSIHPNLIEILTYIREVESNSNVSAFLEFQTNLSQRKEKYEEIKSYVDTFNVSYHHLEVMRNNNYETFIDNLKYLGSEGCLKNLDIMLENVSEDDLANFYNNIKEMLKVPCKYSEMIYGFCHYKFNEETKKKHLDFYKENNKYEQQYNIDGVTYNTNDLFKIGLDCRGWSCQVGRKNITINGDGNVFMCGIHMTNHTHRCSDDPPYTNIVTDSLSLSKLSILRKINFKCRWDFCGGDFYVPRKKSIEE